MLQLCLVMHLIIRLFSSVIVTTVAIHYNTYLFTVTPLESVNTCIKTRQTNFRCNTEFVNIVMHFNFVYNYL